MAAPPTPRERRLEPRRRDDAEAVIRWLRTLGGRLESKPDVRRRTRSPRRRS